MCAFLADLLTFSRVIVAAILVWLGTRGPATLPWAVLAIMLGWTTDQLDGWAARRATSPTRLARFDFAIDTTLYAGILTYGTLAGFVPPLGALAFVGLTVLASLIGRRKAITTLFLRLLDLASLVVVLTHAPWLGLPVLTWLVALGLIYRRRVITRVPQWAGELMGMIRGRSDM
jgi:phosphatidylglycerophosphate synthase